MDLKELFSFTRQVGLFSLYGDEELDDLLKTASLRSCSAGELIFDQGDPGDAFYIVYSGRVRILKRDEQKKEINLALLTRGDHFGETALITDHPRNAAARAVEETTLIIIDKDSFNKHIFSVPQLREHFDKFTRYSSIYNYVRSCTHLSAVPPKELRELVNGFQSEFFKANEVVFRQGAEADRFYLIEKGRVKVIRWEGTRQEIINYLREGEFFGEKALLEAGRRYADIVCLTDCHFFTLGKSAFQDLLLKSPRLRKTIEDRIGSYFAGEPPIPYRELILQELEAQRKPERLETAPPEEERPAAREKKRFKGLASFYRHHVRFPFIRQHDQMTCGTTCLMMIAKYYGKHFSSNRLRELARVDISGASLANLASAAEQLGFSSRAMRLGLDSLRSVQLPCIAHWQGFHYVVVTK
ncbi:MAG: cyclic nucleotide-binding domain-containing protein, partial [Desulfobacteraceae bacterium]|nr:cyclic nucleotide-binding domain-containing protein [Desulfobacteraceae bacterium]